MSDELEQAPRAGELPNFRAIGFLSSTAKLYWAYYPAIRGCSPGLTIFGCYHRIVGSCFSSDTLTPGRKWLQEIPIMYVLTCRHKNLAKVVMKGLKLENRADKVATGRKYVPLSANAHGSEAQFLL